MTTQERLEGLAFPIISVKLSGGVWRATLRRDRDLTVRAQEGYAGVDGARGALPVAVKCWQKWTAASDARLVSLGLTPGDGEGPRVFVPGDAAEGYAFLVVPSYFFGEGVADA